MSDRLRVLPWIGGKSKEFPGATLAPLVSPVDESVVADMVDADAPAVDAAVANAHAAYLAHQETTTAKRVEWLMAAADAVDKIEPEVVAALIRVLGKPKRAATFEHKRSGAFLRACAIQLPHMQGEVLPLDLTALGVNRFGFTTRIPTGWWPPSRRSTRRPTW
jgi:acyl-CoA reductase-like NAD-dependent aldehyde dehydrogenase